MPIYNTKEKMEKRREQLKRDHIDNLLESHKRNIEQGNWFKAKKIEWVLAYFYGIEGDNNYNIGSPQE